MVHLLKIEEIQHLDTNGAILWESKDLDNIFHLGGQNFILNVVFNASSFISVPGNYYLGLDNRLAPQTSDTLASLSAEPTQNGYTRQGVSSANGFSVSVGGDGNYRAISNIATFPATGGSWGPVSNLFLATTSNNAGYLISTVVLDNQRTVAAGEALTVRISVGLVNF